MQQEGGREKKEWEVLLMKVIVVVGNFHRMSPLLCSLWKGDLS